jgi:preprotein translocase subunit YajC
MFLNLALLTGGAPTASLFDFLPSILLFGVIVYFMIIRPNKKRQQNAKDLMSSLQVGDKIQTIGGFIGNIIEMGEDEFVIQSEESKLRIKKNAVAIRVNPVIEPSNDETSLDEDKKEDDDDLDFNIEDFEI